MSEDTTPPGDPVAAKPKRPPRLNRPSRAKAVKLKPGPKPKPKPEPKPKPFEDIRPDQSDVLKGMKSANVKGKPSGRPAHEPDEISRRVVETHAAMNTSEKLIAGFVGISEKTLRKYYGEELLWGRPRLLARVGAMVAQAALKGCKTRQMFILRTLGGPQWRITSDHQHSGPGGEPLLAPQEMLPAYTETLTFEEVQTMHRIRRKVAVAQGVIAAEADSDDDD